VERLAWAHIDVDIYTAVRDCLEFIYPRLVPGGTVVIDDYGFPSCVGARRAVDEHFADGLPEAPLCLPTGQCLIVKVP
jgi:O-methyltransferase